MAADELSRQQQLAFHRRIVSNDPTAFAELCEIALPHLITFLEQAFPGQDAHQRETIAIDILLDYRRRTDQFDPKRLSLFAYLRMAAKYDMLNLIRKNQRRERHLEPIDGEFVELSESDGNQYRREETLQEWVEQYTDLSLREIFVEVETQLEDPEAQVLVMMLERVRSTAEYAEVLGITQLDETSQRREVKRVKDRIMKRLERLGKRIRTYP
ncbi:MAG: sigma-70 family RNA polymerase sigma factor [Anaerolineae bacterium]|nr:sigma-70 family RNA polymerase sigma factor [Anaerolineae bacterium]